MKFGSNSPNIGVTIGLCVKNSESTVKEAVESILDQDYPHKSMELAIVDGHSRDATLAILESILKNRDMKIMRFFENEGLGRARQMVVDDASGEYIVWVDGDMVLSRDFVRKQVDFMEEHPEVGIAKGKYGTLTNGSHNSLVAALENAEFILNTRLEGKTNLRTLGTSGCIYRTKAIKEVGGFDPLIKGVGEDIEVESRIREAGWQLHVTSALFFETRRQTWKSLWKEYFWHGRGGFAIVKKNTRVINLYKMLPPVALISELFRIPAAYRVIRRKAVLLLPLHYVFKRVAWFLGFVSCSLER